MPNALQYLDISCHIQTHDCLQTLYYDEYAYVLANGVPTAELFHQETHIPVPETSIRTVTCIHRIV